MLTGEYAAGIPGLINGPAAILILRRLMIARRRRRDQMSNEPLRPAPLRRSPDYLAAVRNTAVKRFNTAPLEAAPASRVAQPAAHSPGR
jgi:hypothetical protein